MIRMTKQTDYGFVLLTRLAVEPGRAMNAPELAGETKLPLPMVSKILKLLVRQGLLASHRGVKGGYALARPAAEIHAAEILRALEGRGGAHGLHRRLARRVRPGAFLHRAGTVAADQQGGLRGAGRRDARRSRRGDGSPEPSWYSWAGLSPGSTPGRRLRGHREPAPGKPGQPDRIALKLEKR